MPRTIAKNFNFCFTNLKQSHEQDHTTSYNFLYDYEKLQFSPLSSSSFSSAPSSSPDNAEPDLTMVYASERFFVSSPGLSNSIIESTPHRNEACVNKLLRTDSVAIDTLSRDPYKDFRKSMEEMVEARSLVDVKVNWDELHELLMCYLALNPKCTYKFIFRAFTDLLIDLLSSSLSSPSNADHSGKLEGEVSGNPHKYCI